MTNPDSLRPLESFSEDNQETVDGLRDPKPETRLATLYDLGEADDELVDEILRVFLDDSSEEVRGAAAIALGPTLELCDWELDEEGRLNDDELYGAPLSQAAYDRATGTLKRVATDPAQPKLVRRRALEAAVRSTKPWQEAATREAWAADDEAWRATALFCMGYLHRVDFASEIEDALGSDSLELAREAILAAGQRDMGHLLPRIMTVAADRDAQAELRYAAVEALGSLGGDDAQSLLESLTSSRDTTMAELAEVALENLRISRSVDELDDDQEW